MHDLGRASCPAFLFPSPVIPARARTLRREPALARGRYSSNNNGGKQMLQYALLFLIIALVAGILGFGGIAGAASGIAQLLFFLFLAFLVISLLVGLFRRGRTP
jgi:uncharacterized membrane protein YtjA (UPF0391 family)